MARFHLDFDKGDEKSDVSIVTGGSATQDIRVIIDDTAFNSVSDVANHIRLAAQVVEENDWPPV